MKSDREFIAGIYEKAALRANMATAMGSTTIETDNAKQNIFEKLDIFKRPYVSGLCFAAVCLIVITGVVGLTGGFSAIGYNKNNADIISENNTDIMLLRANDVDFEISVKVKDIVFEEDTVKIECITLEEVEGKVQTGEDLSVSMSKQEYDSCFPDGISEGEEHVFNVYETQTGLRILPFIQ